MRLDSAPRVIVGGETRAGARLAAEVGDGWTAYSTNFRQNLPLYLDALEDAGRRRADQRLIVAFQGGAFLGPEDGDPLAAWCDAPRDTWEDWREAGADGLILTAATDEDVDRLDSAAELW